MICKRVNAQCCAAAQDRRSKQPTGDRVMGGGWTHSDARADVAIFLPAKEQTGRYLQNTP
jgi:hypothetical protein